MITQKEEEKKDEYVGAPKPFEPRTRYEDYEECEDYEDTDDYDALTEWGTLPEKVWTPYMQKDPKPTTPTGRYGN